MSVPNSSFPAGPPSDSRSTKKSYTAAHGWPLRQFALTPDTGRTIRGVRFPCVSSKRGIFVAPFEGLSEPRLVARLAARAEEQGWDGFFVWDHIRYSAPTSRLADPWVTMSAIACATERLIIGPLVTPV